MLMQLLLVCYGQFSLQFLPFLSGKLQLLLPAALLGLQMLLSADALWQGVRDLVHPSLYTPGAVLCVLALLDSVQQLSAGTPATPPRQPLCCSAAPRPDARARGA